MAKYDKTIENRSMVRFIDTESMTISEDTRTIEVSLSSEFPVSRWDGDEILVHTKEAIDLSRFPLPLCVSHETYRGLNIGLIENPVLSDGKLRATLRFGERSEAEEYWTDVKNGIIRNISIGYIVRDVEDVDKSVYRVTGWMPYEGSLVSVPADNTVGVGRSSADANIPTLKNLEGFEEMVQRFLKSATNEQKTKFTQRFNNIVDEYNKLHPEAPDESDVPPEKGVDPMIPNLRRQVELKNKLITMES